MDSPLRALQSYHCTKSHFCLLPVFTCTGIGIILISFLGVLRELDRVKRERDRQTKENKKLKKELKGLDQVNFVQNSKGAFLHSKLEFQIMYNTMYSAQAKCIQCIISCFLLGWC
jgi:hypothetical protein